MPYIKKERREELDGLIELMEVLDVKADGDLNYILFKFCLLRVDKSYNSLKNYIGELNQCATEIERRILAPYEDVKIKENGDVE